MKIERLKQKNKKPFIIGAILVVVIGGALTYRLTHSKYRTTQSINLATGTINYTVPDFRIVEIKTSEDKINYNDVSSVPTSGYVLNTTKSVCNVDNTKDSNITIEYSNGKANFKNVTKKGTKCYLYFDKQLTGGDYILANITPKTTTPDFSKVATTDEGVFEATDEMYDNGKTYYWRGAVTNNYVKFARFCWRIIRINGDGTIRMIYDGNSCHANGTNTAESIAVASQAYNPTYNASYYVGWTQNGTQRTNSASATASNAKTQTENWFTSNITGTNATKVADGKYCNDRDVGQPLSSWSGYVTQWSATGTQFAYAGPKRLYENYSPTFNCPSGDVYTLKVGLITADEVEFAGGKNENNTSYYLYNGQYYWTMSPCNWDGTSAGVFAVSSSGDLNYWSVGHTSPGLRPVINLKADTTFSSGNGEQSTPYVVS